MVRSGSIPNRSWKWDLLKTGMSEMWEKENQDKARVFDLSSWKSVSSGGADRQEQLLRWKSAVGTFSLWVHLIINVHIN